MEKKELNEKEMEIVNGGQLDRNAWPITCPKCKFEDTYYKFYYYETGGDCGKQGWRVCPKCNTHFKVGIGK